YTEKGPRVRAHEIRPGNPRCAHRRALRPGHDVDRRLVHPAAARPARLLRRRPRRELVAGARFHRGHGDEHGDVPQRPRPGLSSADGLEPGAGEPDVSSVILWLRGRPGADRRAAPAAVLARRAVLGLRPPPPTLLRP